MYAPVQSVPKVGVSHVRRFLHREKRTSPARGDGLVQPRRLARRKQGWLAAGLCLLFLLFACTGAALAARPHEFKTTFGTAGSGPGQFKEPDGVAIDEATGDVYVVDKGNNRVERFDSKGSFLGEFAGTSASGSGALTEESNVVEGVLTTTGEFSVGQEVSGEGIPAGTRITEPESTA